MREPNTFAQRNAFQEPDTVSGYEPVCVSDRDPDSLSGYELDSGRDPNSFDDPVPLARQLPEQQVAVGFHDVRHRHRHVPVG
jgi:hypothetical protein